MSGHPYGGSKAQDTHRIHIIYTGAYVAFVLLLATLEQLGIGENLLAYLFVSYTFATYAGIGILSRTNRVSEFHVAGRSVSPLYNGLATGSDWISGSIFIGYAGAFYFLGYDSLAYVIGWSGGFVLIAVLIAPYLRKLGAFTVPDFLHARFGGKSARLLGVIVLLCCSFVLLVAQLTATGLIASRFLDLSFDIALSIGVAGILLCSFLGGMRAITWTQVAQYIVLIIAYLIPAMWMSGEVTGIPIAPLMYGEALQEISVLEAELAVNGLADTVSSGDRFVAYDPFNFFALIFCLMLGTASLPHVLMRYFTTSSVRGSRTAAGWSLVAVLLLVVTAPAYAAFVKLEIYRNVVGLQVGDLARAAGWIFDWGSVEGRNLIALCGQQASSPELVAQACGGIDHKVLFSDLTFDRDMVVLAAPEITGLPFAITAMVAAGALAAALSTANGLVLAIGNAFSHDIYHAMVDRNAPTSRRLLVARIFLLGTAVAAAYVASARPADLLELATWPFSLAAAGLFPALVLGIWWKRCTAAGAIAGIACGFAVALFYLLGNVYGPDLARGSGDELVWAVAGMTDNVMGLNAGVFGVPAGFLVMIAVSLLTPAPSRDIRDLIDEIRKPAGETILRDGDPPR